MCKKWTELLVLNFLGTCVLPCTSNRTHVSIKISTRNKLPYYLLLVHFNKMQVSVFKVNEITLKIT